jgi:hypothetical protein
MPGIAEIPELILEAAVVVAPGIARIPLLGRLIVAFGHPITDTQALEQFQSAADRNKKTRLRTQHDTNKRVIKVGDALKCVESSIMDGKIGLAFARGVVNMLSGSADVPGEVLYKEIERCILAKMLGQGSRRSGNVRRTSSHRPSRGHGRGRF